MCLLSGWITSGSVEPRLSETVGSGTLVLTSEPVEHLLSEAVGRTANLAVEHLLLLWFEPLSDCDGG